MTDAAGPAEVVRHVRLGLPDGLHARPATRLVFLLDRFPARLTVRCGDRSADGRSTLELLCLDAHAGAELELRAAGPQASEMLDAVAALLEAPAAS